MEIGEVCSREVCCIGPDELLADAARELLRRQVGALVVVARRDPRFPCGIVTDRDIVCGQLARRADLFCLTVGDVMTPEPLTLPETLDLDEAIQRMQDRGVRRAPVVASSGSLVGIVSLDDLLPLIAQDLGSLAALVERQSSRERSL